MKKKSTNLIPLIKGIKLKNITMEGGCRYRLIRVVSQKEPRSVDSYEALMRCGLYYSDQSDIDATLWGAHKITGAIANLGIEPHIKDSDIIIPEIPEYMGFD